MDWLNSRIKQTLDARHKSGNYRVLGGIHELIDFTSNDYLGLARSSIIKEAVRHRTDDIGIRNGSTGSRLLSGNYSLIEELEELLSRIFDAEACLVFNSGYVANLALHATLASKGDSIMYDQFAHVCIKEGAAMSRASSFPFYHNDPNDLENRLRRAEGRSIISVESIYSMDGDECCLDDLISLSQRYEAPIFIDEAHSTGVMGRSGNGYACSKRKQEEIFARIYTFGKAIGSHGACVCGSRSLIEYLKNFAAPFIYTTAMSPHNVLTVMEAFYYLREKGEQLQLQLNENIQQFKKLIKVYGLEWMQVGINSDSAIQPLIVSGNEEIKRTSAQLFDENFDIRPILSPTVRKGAERLRVCLHAYNTPEEIEALLRILSAANLRKGE